MIGRAREWLAGLSTVVGTVLMLGMPPAAASSEAQALMLPAQGAIGDLKYHALTRPDPERALDPAALLISDGGFVPYDPVLDREAPPGWLKLPVSAPEESNGQYVLRVGRRFFVRFELYVDRPAQPPSRHVADIHELSGVRTVGREFAVDLEVPAGESATLLLYVDTLQGSLQPLKMWVQDESGFAESRTHTYLILGLIFGVLIALIFHNFVLYLNLRLRGHLYYVLAMTSMLIMLGIDSGLLQNYLLPEPLLPWVNRLNILFAGLMMITIALFFQAFVRSERHTPRLTVAIRIGMVIIAGIVVVQLFLPAELHLRAGMAMQLSNVAVFLLLVVGAWMAGRKGVIEGWIFLAAWGLFWIGAMSRTMLTLDLTESTLIRDNLMYFGAVAEASILALGLSFRVRQLYERHAMALREQHRAARLANTDPLTGAYNRRFLQHYLDNIIHESPSDSFSRALLILDLDHFKEANDEYGHAAGDLILRELVQRCQRVMRESDVLCRLGGDEFVIVLSDQGERTAMDVAVRLVEEIGTMPYRYGGQSISTTTSIGVVPNISPRTTASAVLRMADQALYQAKQAGRNRATLFDPDTATPFRHGASLALKPEEKS